MRRPGGELEAVADREVQGATLGGRVTVGRLTVGQPEADRSRGHDDHLVVAVIVGGIAFAGPVRPRTGIEPLVLEATAEIGRVVRGRHQAAIETPMTDPIAYVTVAATSPIPSWRMPENSIPRPVSRLTAAPTAKSATRLS